MWYSAESGSRRFSEAMAPLFGNADSKQSFIHDLSFITVTTTH